MEKKVMYKKGHQMFGEEKCTLRQNPGYVYEFSQLSFVTALKFLVAYFSAINSLTN